MLIRAYGVTIDQGPGYVGTLKAGEVEAPLADTVSVEVCNEPPFVAQRMVLPRYLQGDGATAQARLEPVLPESNVDGVWIVARASTPAWLSTALLARALNLPGHAQRQVLVVNEFGPELARLRAVALVAVMAYAGSSPGATLELFETRGELAFSPFGTFADAHWENGYTLLALPTTITRDVAQAGTDRVLAALRPVFEKHAAGTAGPRLRALGLCAEWLLSANRLALSSNELFVMYYQCLEALCTLADQSPDLDLIAKLERITDVVRGSGQADGATLLSALQTVRERTVRAPVRVLFARLGAELAMPNAARDAEIFAMLARVRNDLLHARVTSVPPTVGGVEVFAAARDLATQYFRAALKADTGARP